MKLLITLLILSMPLTCFAEDTKDNKIAYYLKDIAISLRNLEKMEYWRMRYESVGSPAYGVCRQAQMLKRNLYIPRATQLKDD